MTLSQTGQKWAEMTKAEKAAAAKALDSLSLKKLKRGEACLQTATSGATLNAYRAAWGF